VEAEENEKKDMVSGGTNQIVDFRRKMALD
jgi:hypothetical protein